MKRDIYPLTKEQKKSLKPVIKDIEAFRMLSDDIALKLRDRRKILRNKIKKMFPEVDVEKQPYTLDSSEKVWKLRIYDDSSSQSKVINDKIENITELVKTFIGRLDEADKRINIISELIETKDE